MKILHINALQIGGAALCAQRICEALINKGIESKMLVAEGEPHDYIYVAEEDKSQEVDFWYRNPFLGKIKHLLMRTPWYWDEEKFKTEFRKAQANTQERPYIHIPYSDCKNIINHPLIEWCDIIHLHWVSGMIDYPSFFKNIKKPIVWTLHDQHPAIGLMHYQSKFSQLPESYEYIDKVCINIKKKSLQQSKELHLVAISKMMRETCENSKILSKFPTHIIHNGVKEDIFKPYNKQEMRKKFGIPTDATVFLFSSYDIWDKRKGLERVIDALEQLNMPNAILICIGNNYSKKKINSHIQTITTGGIDVQNQLAKLYSLSDFFINASYEEAFAQTPLEAMACGTPVISTPCSGAPDLIRQFNGVLCSGFNDEDIAKGIKEALTYQNTQGYSISDIRNYIVNNYSYDIISKQYIELYNKILSI